MAARTDFQPRPGSGPLNGRPPRDSGHATIPIEEETIMTMKNTLAAASVAVATMALMLGSASAQSKLVLKASDVHPEGYPTVAAVESMGKTLEKATNGRVTVQMFPSMQLGGEKEAIEQAQVGAIALARVSVGALGPVVDDLNVFNLPYVFRNTEHMRHVIDGQIGQDLLDKVTNSGKGLVGLCWMDAGARGGGAAGGPGRGGAGRGGRGGRGMG